MGLRRRDFLVAGLAGAGALAVPGAAVARSGRPPRTRGLAERIVTEFRKLPGTKALMIHAPREQGLAPFTVTINPRRTIFVGSCIKVFILAEYLRQVESGRASLDDQLDLDESIWSLVSTRMNPPNLVGKVNAITALSAMMAVSDNTATDMCLRRLGPTRVRALIASLGLRNVRIPNSTRELFAYVFGAPNYATVTWDELLAVTAGEAVHPIINDVSTMASTPLDLVSFYQRALPGRIFRQEGTLATFRQVLGETAAITNVYPLGANGFSKGGSIDVGDEQALNLAGGMYVPDRWIYFSVGINWTLAQAGPLEEVQPELVGRVTRIMGWLYDGLRE